MINGIRAASRFTWGNTASRNHLYGGGVIAAKGRNQEEPQGVPGMETRAQEDSHRNGANTLVLPRPLSLLSGESLAYVSVNETSWTRS